MNVCYFVRQATEGFRVALMDLTGVMILKTRRSLLVTILGTTPCKFAHDAARVYWVPHAELRFTSMIIYAQRLNCHFAVRHMGTYARDSRSPPVITLRNTMDLSKILR